MSMRRLCWLVVAMMWMVAGCGDDDTDAGDAPNQINGEVEEEDGELEGCEEEETINPITGACVPAPGQGDQGEGSDNDGEGGAEESPNGEESANQPPGGEEGNGGDEEEELECGPGGVIGQTCRPDGGAIPGATVTLSGFDCQGAPFEVETAADGQGYYDFSDVPSGDHSLTITSGSFEVEEDVTIVAGQITDRESIGEKVCLTGTEVNIAVIDGAWDDISGILDDMLIEYDFYNSTSDLLGDLDAMRDYEIIFVECSNSITSGSGFSQEDMKFNVRRFVEEGGSLYGSDLAWDVVQRSVPEAMTFVNVTGDGQGSPFVGSGSQTVIADVTSTQMEDMLGQDTVEIYFNTGFAVIEEIAESGGTAHFSGHINASGVHDGQYFPLMADYQDPLGNGYLIYTSFHNSAQATGDVQQILEYMIFQL